MHWLRVIRRSCLCAFLVCVPILLLFGLAQFALHATHAATVSLSLSITHGPPTSLVTASGTGYGSTEKVVLKMDTTLLGSVFTDSTGTFSTTIIVPASTLPGNHPIFAAGLSSHTSTSTRFAVWADWGQSDGDALRTHFNPYETLLSPTTVSGLVVDWQHCFPAMTCPPGRDRITSVEEANGMVYALANGQADRLWAVNAATGKELWVGGYIHRQGLTEPTIANGVVYWSMGGGNILDVFDATTGKYSWSYQFHHNLVTPPEVGNNMVYVPSPEGYLLALDAATGTLRWQHYLKEHSTTPTFFNNVVYTCLANNPQGKMNLNALNAQTGAFLWRFPSPCEIPRIVNGIVYAEGSNGYIALNAATGSLVWQSSAIKGAYAIGNGVVYGSTGSGDVVELDAATGAFLRQFTLPASGSISAVANGVIYGTTGKVLYALDATTGTPLWSYAAPSGVNDPFAPPIVTNGVVYSGSNGYVVAFHLPGMTP